MTLNEVTARQFARATFPLRQAEATGSVGGRLSSADSARLVNETVQQVQGDPEDLARYLPRYLDFRCSGDGVMWLQPMDLEEGGMAGGPDWIRIAPSGTVQSVRLPDRFDPFRFAEDRIWGIQRDEFDVASVAWIELPEAMR